MSAIAANRSVNRYLADKAMDRIDHALGRPLWPLRESYRNHYAIDLDAPGRTEFEASSNWVLTAAAVSSNLAIYSVTPAGREALDRYLRETSKVCGWLVQFGGYSCVVPAESAAKARYSYYLEVSDSRSELRFGDFVRQTSVRRAA